MRWSILVTVLWQGVALVPGLWGRIGSTALMMRGGVTLGLAAAILRRIAPVMADARKRDTL
jgi:hypothetical protein